MSQSKEDPWADMSKAIEAWTAAEIARTFGTFGQPPAEPLGPSPADPGPGKATDVQVGGGHYKGMAIQPVEYIVQNDLGYLEGNVVKYISRHQNKSGAEDIRKAIHYCQLILQYQYGEKEVK